MARIPRPHNPRTVRIWPGMTTDDTPDTFIVINATGYSLPIYAGEAYGGFNVELNVTAGLTGSFSVQASMEPCPELTTDADWFTITPTVIAGALAYAGSAAITVVAPPNNVTVLPEWFRIKYTHTSGAATIRAFSRVDNIH